MRFPPDFVEKVREANNIVDIIAPYTQLRSSGANFMGRCPFPDHNDKTASFSVSEDKQLYNCFGCKKSGNIFTFLEAFNGYSFPESIEYLAKRANIAMPERDEDPRAKRDREQREAILAANRLASSFFRDRFQKLAVDHPVRTYTEKRGLSADLIEKFEIGYSPDEWHALSSVLKARKFSSEVGERAGLIKKSSRSAGAESFDLFRGRLMFPIVTTSGDTIGFGGRVVGEGEPKYLNSPETPVFHKGKTLYGLNVTARYIRSLDEAIIVEGYMDALSLYGAGVTNVAAILGTAFTPEHGKLLKRMTPNVVMLLDGDRAGIQGAERSLGALLASDLRPRGVILPEGMDPDDFIRERGVEAFREQIQGAGDLFTLLLTRHWMANYRNTAQDKLRVVESASNALLGATPTVALAILEKPLGELFISEIAKFMDVEVGWVRKTMSRILSGAPMGKAPVSVETATGTSLGNSPGTSLLGARDSFNRGPQIVPSSKATVAPVNMKAPSEVSSVSRPLDARVEHAETNKTARVVEAPETRSETRPETPIGMRSNDTALEKIDLTGVSREELSALALVLQSRTLMQDLSEASRDWAQERASAAGAANSSPEDHPIAMILDHAGARKLLAMALRRYGHQPSSFATLTASLMGTLVQPQLLSSAIAQINVWRREDHDKFATGSSETSEKTIETQSPRSSERTADSKFESEVESEVDTEDRRRMSLVIKAIQKKRKQDALQSINLKLRGQLSPEESRVLMERFVELQREIRELQNSENRFELK